MAAADRRYVRHRDGAQVTAAQFDGRVAGFGALLSAFPDRLRPHPHRDDALLLLIDDRQVRIEAGDWIVMAEHGQLETHSDDAFQIGFARPLAMVA